MKKFSITYSKKDGIEFIIDDDKHMGWIENFDSVHFNRFFIVIDKTPAFRSIIASSRLVLYHWQETFLILLLMFLITLRIIFNILLVFIIPALVIIPAGYIATKTLATIGIIFGIILGLIALFFAAYFSGILEVFTSTVWVKTFLSLTTKEEVSARDAAENPLSLGTSQQ